MTRISFFLFLEMDFPRGSRGPSGKIVEFPGVGARPCGTENPGGGGSNWKNPPCGGYGYFLEPYIGFLISGIILSNLFSLYFCISLPSCFVSIDIIQLLSCYADFNKHIYCVRTKACDSYYFFLYRRDRHPVDEILLATWDREG